MSVIIFLFIFHGVLAVDECKFDFGTLYPHDKIQACINTIPYNSGSNEVKNLIGVIKGYLDNYVFLDVNSYPPAPYNSLKLDLFNELDSLNSKLSTFGGTFDFWWEISSILLKMKDAHTSFSPCDTSIFWWVIPFDFRANGQSKTIIATPNSFTEPYLEIAGAVDLSGKIITKIDMKDAWQALDEFAESDSISKNQNTRFNYVLRGVFSMRSPFKYAPPGALLKVEYEDGAGSPQEVNIPFYSVSSMPITSVNELCPLKSTLTVTGKKNVLKSAAKTTNATKTLAEAFAAAYKRSELEFLEKEKTKLRMMKEMSRPLGHLRTGSGNGTQTQTLEPAHAHKEEERELVPLTDTSRTEIFNEDFGSAYIFDEAGKKTGYLKITGFGDADVDERPWASTVGGALKTIKVTHDAENLIIDLRGNGGGAMALGLGLSALLFPSEQPANATIFDMRKSDFLTFINDFNLLPMLGTVLDPGTLGAINKFDSYVSKGFKYADGTTFNHYYTPKFIVVEDDPYADLKAAWPDRGSAPLYSPEHLIVLTDGMCGSACAVFIKRIQELKQARIVQVGGHKKTGNNLPSEFDVGSFAGGSLFSSAAFEALKLAAKQMEEENGVPGYLTSHFPAAFLREGTELSFTRLEVFSYTRPNELLEFVVNPPDFVEEIYPPYKEPNDVDFVASELNRITAYFNKCASWENCEAQGAALHLKGSRMWIVLVATLVCALWMF